jgi:hypothetical protein
VVRVESFKFLGVHISNEQSWSINQIKIKSNFICHIHMVSRC